MRIRVFGVLTAIALLWAGGTAASDLCPVPVGAEPATPSTELARTRAVLASGGPLKIVAMGSSSTQGHGASVPSAAYPAQLQAMLGLAYGGSRIKVVNKGVGGDTAGANLVRFARDVLSEKPDLVIWQIGTNDSVGNVPVGQFKATVREGAALVRAIGADLIFMNPQYFLREVRYASYSAYVAAVSELGHELKVPVLDRYGIMKWWVDSGLFKTDAILSSDGFHMKDPSYHCLAEFLTRMIELPALQGKVTATAH
jgi:lysophospholipase L1-like esterase